MLPSVKLSAIHGSKSLDHARLHLRMLRKIEIQPVGKSVHQFLAATPDSPRTAFFNSAGSMNSFMRRS